MVKKIYFGLVRKNGMAPLEDNFTGPEYELYLINDSNDPITLKDQSFGGFISSEKKAALSVGQNISAGQAISAGQDMETDMRIPPHSYILYKELYADSFNNVRQHQAIIDIKGALKQLTFHTSRRIGFMGSLIPCVYKFGRIIYPTIEALSEKN